MLVPLQCFVLFIIPSQYCTDIGGVQGGGDVWGALPVHPQPHPAGGLAPLSIPSPLLCVQRGLIEYCDFALWEILSRMSLLMSKYNISNRRQQLCVCSGEAGVSAADVSDQRQGLSGV